MNSTLLKELLDLGDAFEQQHPNPADQHVGAFLDWAAQHKAPAALPNSEGEEATYGPVGFPVLPVLPAFIAHYLSLAYRYHRLHIRKMLHNTPLLTYDDLIFLLVLAKEGSQTKMSLVETTVNDKASGMLVIKRLLDKGFALQTDDPTDLRSRRITITEAGKALLTELIPEANQAFELLVFALSKAEQQQFANLLTKIDQFHNPLYRHEKETPPGTLLERAKQGHL